MYKKVITTMAVFCTALTLASGLHAATIELQYGLPMNVIAENAANKLVVSTKCSNEEAPCSTINRSVGRAHPLCLQHTLTTLYQQEVAFFTFIKQQGTTWLNRLVNNAQAPSSDVRECLSLLVLVGADPYQSHWHNGVFIPGTSPLANAVDMRATDLIAAMKLPNNFLHRHIGFTEIGDIGLACIMSDNNAVVHLGSQPTVDNMVDVDDKMDEVSDGELVDSTDESDSEDVQ